MKKTLIALAAVAATGAAFAQSAVLSGNYTGGYVTQQNAGKKAVSGLHTDTARIQLDASEDLGGGLKAAAQVSVANLNRNGVTGGENAFVQLSGGFGTVKFGSVETGDAYDTAGGALQQGWGHDGLVLGANVNTDNLSYTLPKFGDVSVTLSYNDYSKTAAQAGDYGSSSTATLDNVTATGSQASYGIGVAYATGPLSVSGGYTMYGLKDLSADAAKTKLKLNAQYDLGVAKLGFGYFTKAKEVTDNNTAMTAGVSVPLGAVTLGASYAQSKSYAAGNVETKKNGFVAGANYEFSKTVNLNASYYT